MISVFDIFKIGIGPSSSHTVGPMKAGKQFTDDLIARGLLADVSKVVVDVYGSLSLTGKGHHTDIAIIMGLAGNLPDTVENGFGSGCIQLQNHHGPVAFAFTPDMHAGNIDAAVAQKRSDFADDAGPVGVLGNDQRLFRVNDPKAAYGAGLRVRINNDGLNIRADYAFGKQSTGLYLTLGEAF